VEKAKSKFKARSKLPKCYFCSAPVNADRRYEIKQLRPVETFLNLNPQWLSFGKVFDGNTVLCNQAYCLAAAFENWRQDSFGIKSPRSPRQGGRNKSPQKSSPQRPAHLFEQDRRDDEEDEDAHELTGSPNSFMRKLSMMRPLDMQTEMMRLSMMQPDDMKKELDREAGDEGDTLLGAGWGNSDQEQEHHGSGQVFGADIDNHELFFKSVESRREQLAQLRENKGAPGAGTSGPHNTVEAKVQAGLVANREERLRVARRLQELRDRQPQIELEKAEKLKVSIMERKREIYKQLVSVRIEEKLAKAKIEKYDFEQKISLMKLDAYAKAKIDQEHTGDETKLQKLQDSSEAVLAHLAHVPQAQEIVERGLELAEQDKEYEQQSSAITQELQHALREAYTKGKEDLLEERRKLTAGRFELEARMGQLKQMDENDKENKKSPDEEQSNYDPLDQMDDEFHRGARKDDEPFESAYALAERMDVIVEKNIDVLTKRILKGVDEKDWLHDEPKNNEWKAILGRVSHFRQEAADIPEKNKQLQKYLTTNEEHRGYMQAEKNAHLREIAIMACANQFVQEIYDEWIKKFCQTYFNLAKDCLQLLDTAILDALCGGTAIEKEFLRSTGREYLLLGTLHDIRHKSYNMNCDTSGPRALYNIDVSQANCINSNFKRDSGFNYSGQQHAMRRKDYTPHTNKKSTLFDYLDNFLLVDDKIRLKPLEKAEKMHWAKTALQNCRTSPLVFPNISAGRIEIIRCFPTSYTHSSLLIAAVHTGSFAAWTVPWTGATPLLISVSPALERKNRCDIIDIREGSLNSTTILCLYRNGHIRVWDLNPVSSTGRRKESSHLWNMFPDNVAHFVPVVPSCVFHLNPLDLSMPLELGDDGKPITTEEAIELADKNAKKNALKKRIIAERSINNPFAGGAGLGKTAAAEHQVEEGFLFGTKKSKLTPQPGTHPMVACFHPSMTITGRNPSILVGSDGGDIIKFNIDYRINNLDAPILYLPPFVDVEYVHPQNAPDLILSAGRPRRGNRVYRELFHFHQTTIIFIGIVDKVSEKIVTMDDMGYIALWEYTAANFKGLCWYEPVLTTLLDVDWKSFAFMANTPDDEQIPSNDLLKELKVRSRSMIKQMVFPFALGKTTSLSADGQPKQKAEVEFIQEVYYPVKLEGKLVEFTSLVPTKEKRNREGEIIEPAWKRRVDANKPSQTWAEDFPPGETRWSSQFVKEVVNHTSIEQVTMSDDGSEMFLCLSFTVDNRFGKNITNQQPYTSNIAIAGISLATLDFRPPFPRFELKSGETLRSITFSPINSETLTRVAFVHLSSCTRIFSMETGLEIITSTFPMRTDLPSFDPHLMALCPSQRVIGFAGPQDTRLDIKIFIHMDDGKEEEAMADSNLLTDDVLKAIRLPKEQLEKYTVKTVLTTEIAPDFEYEMAKLEAERFITYCWNAFDIALERKKSYDERKRLTVSVFSKAEDLGVIQPVFWPPNYDRNEEKSREAISVQYNRNKRREEEKTRRLEGIAAGGAQPKGLFGKIGAMFSPRSGKEQADNLPPSPERSRSRTGSEAASPRRDPDEDWHKLPPSGLPPYSDWDGVSYFSLARPEFFEGAERLRADSLSSTDTDDDDDTRKKKSYAREQKGVGLAGVEADSKGAGVSGRAAFKLLAFSKKFKHSTPGTTPRNDEEQDFPSANPGSPVSPAGAGAVPVEVDMDMDNVLEAMEAETKKPAVKVTKIAPQEPEESVRRRMSMSPRGKLLAAANAAKAVAGGGGGTLQ